MLILLASIACLVVAIAAARPRGLAAPTAAIAGGALATAVGGERLPQVERAAAEALALAAFLTAVMTLADLVVRSGLAERLADALAARAGGRASRLFALVCLCTVGTTAALSLDGAVVLLVPVVLLLAERHAAPAAPLLLGTVALANASSIALPQGNPTNLVVMARLGVGPGAFVERLGLPALAASLVCAGLVALRERQALRVPLGRVAPAMRPRRGAAGLAALGLAGTAAAGWAATLLGIAPWWPMAAAAACTVLAESLRARRAPRLRIPWRAAALVFGLLVVTAPLAAGLGEVFGHRGGAATLALAVAVTAVFAAAANNLPATVAVAAALVPGLAAWGGLVGLAVGALVTPHGSVATIVAFDLSGRQAPRGRRYLKVVTPAAVAAVVVAAVVLGLGG